MDGALAHRIAALAEQLAFLRQELGCPATDPQTGLAAAQLSPDGLRTLKLEVDQMRLFLWAYMDTWSVFGGDPKHRLQRMRMDAAAEMLHQLQNDCRTSGIPGTAEARRLAYELHSISQIMPE